MATLPPIYHAILSPGVLQNKFVEKVCALHGLEPSQFKRLYHPRNNLVKLEFKPSAIAIAVCTQANKVTKIVSDPLRQEILKHTSPDLLSAVNDLLMAVSSNARYVDITSDEVIRIMVP